MDSVNYFRKRAEQRMKSAHDRAIGPVMNVSHHYRKSIQKLSNDVQHLLNKVATSPQEARDLLNEYIPNDEYNKLLEQFKTTKNKQVRNEIKQRLKAQAVSHRIRRKEALISAIERERLARTDHQLNVTERFLSSVFNKEVQSKATDFGLAHFAEIDTNRIKQVLKENWLGSNYSKRIWSNQQEVANQMREKIMQRFMTGQPPKKIMQEMLLSGGLVETDIYKYNRLLRTETSYVVNRADLEVSKKLGIDKRMFIATLDSRTSSKCREQHNKIVRIKDTVIGVNTPPLHPFCRSIMVDYIPGLSDDKEWEEKTDISDNKDYMSKQRLFTPTHGTKKIRINAKSIDSKDRYWIGDGTKETRNTLEKTKGYFEDISSIFDIPSKIVIAPQHKLAGIAAYDHKTDILYISNLLHSEKSVKNLLSSGYFAANKFNDIISHELAHKLHWDRVKLFAKSKGLSYNIFEAKEELEAQLRKYLKEQEMQDPHYISKTISRNAEIHFKNGSLNELIADSIVKLENNKLKDDMLIKLVKGVLGL